jgi:hypothetical protein
MEETLTLEELTGGIDTAIKGALETHLTPPAQVPEVPTPEADQVISMGQDGEYELVSRADVALQQWSAEMHQGALAPIERPLNALTPNVPAGSVLIGGSIGLLGGELIDGFVSPSNDAGGVNMANVAVKAGAAFFLGAFGNRLLTKQGVLAGVVVLGLQVASDVLPLNEWIAAIVSRVNSIGGGEGALQQAQEVAVARQRKLNAAQPGPVGPVSSERSQDVLGGVLN